MKNWQDGWMEKDPTEPEQRFLSRLIQGNPTNPECLDG
jgi:hypothetical protein